jgi:hypothetical protein
MAQTPLLLLRLFGVENLIQKPQKPNDDADDDDEREIFGNEPQEKPDVMENGHNEPPNSREERADGPEDVFNGRHVIPRSRS